MENKEVLTDKDWKEIRDNRSVRTNITRASFYWFFHIYFAHYITFPTAEFQKEMMSLSSNSKIEQLVICAFRGSGKSTIITTALPLWSIVGDLHKKFIVICSQTQAQARQHLANLVDELENNELKSSQTLRQPGVRNSLPSKISSSAVVAGQTLRLKKSSSRPKTAD